MMKNLQAILMTIALSTAGLADDVTSEAALKVDLKSVVSAGVVRPIDGISSAGQPDEAALVIFAEQGYTTVIDLRTEREDRGMDEAAVIEDLGMEYISIPIAGLEAINFENAARLNKLIDAAEGPVLIHCGSANRVGALLALRKSLDGADDETALQYGREGGMTGLEDRVREVLNEK